MKLKNTKQVHNYILNYSKRIDAAYIKILNYMVAQLVNHARDNAGYTVRTGNLISSIGGVLIKDGKPIKYSGFTKHKSADIGDSEGMDFINSLLTEQRNGYVIVIVAGMKYATFVEDELNKNVLRKSELELIRELPKMLDIIKREIEA